MHLQPNLTIAGGGAWSLKGSPSLEGGVCRLAALWVRKVYWNWVVVMVMVMVMIGVVLAPPVEAAQAEKRAVDDSASLFVPGAVSKLRIELSREAYAELKKYHQVAGQPHPERVDVLATVREGDWVYTNVAVHLKGSYSFQSLEGKPSLTLNFDKYAEGQRFHGLDKIHLNNSVQDPTFLSEKLARELFVEAGVPASRIGYATVTLNGRALGFYVLVEGYNKRFVKRHFKSAKGNLYDGGSGGDITRALEVDSGESPTNRADLAALVLACREKNVTNRFAVLSKQLDMDRFLTFAAMEVLLQHWDGYCMGPNNFRIFHDMDRDRMVFFPHGMDQLLGMGNSPPSAITPKWDGLVARAVMTTPEGRRRYLERLGQVYTNLFVESRLLKWVDTHAETVREHGTGGLMESIQYQALVRNLKVRMSNRIADVGRQLAAAETPFAFDETGNGLVRGWKFRENNRSAMKGVRTRDGARDYLELVVEGEEWTSGSWRRTVLLDAGRYELVGLARASGIAVGATNSGVVLRVSGERSGEGVVVKEEWTPLRYPFEVAARMEVELICEFRGSQGRGGFDARTLKLRRLGKDSGR